MNAALKAQLKRFKSRRRLSKARKRLERALPRVENPRGRVAVIGAGVKGFSGSGKHSEAFFPAFAYTLAREGIATFLVGDRTEAEKNIRPGDVAINIFNEVGDFEALPLRDADLTRLGAALVFNRTETAGLIRDKRVMNDALAEGGVPMPRRATGTTADFPVFANAAMDSGAATGFHAPGETLDPTRYNAEFIDSTLDWRGETYFTSVRLITVGRRIIQTLLRARPTSAAARSVHGVDTPLDPELVLFLHDHYERDALKAKYQAVADAIDARLGAGFWAHDLVVRTSDEAVFVCEAGFKFDNDAHAHHFRPISGYVPMITPLYTGALARASAEAFLAECERHGVLGRKSSV